MRRLFPCILAVMAGMIAAQAWAAPKGACGLPPGTEAALSPDGKLAAFIRDIPNADIPDGKEGNLWLRNCRSGRERRVMPAPGMPNREGNIGAPVFSLDGRVLYVGAAPGGDETTIYRVDPTTGKYEIAFYAELNGIIRTGRYRGDILATQHTALYKGRGDDTGYGGYPYYVFDPQGHALRYIGGSQDWNEKRLLRWLKGQGWEISWAGRAP
ncbi:hypothetical protein [Asticcacaulis solisilvae]|uniref:hypothetical protein n=1 Tax=Asticcacaulis solisilvae TaxID=1217274 RepID=UPI003FD724D9